MRGHIRKRGQAWETAIYLGRDPDRGRKRYDYRSHRTRAAAEEYIARALGGKLEGKPIAGSRKRLGEFLGEWLQTLSVSNLAPLTRLQYTRHLRKHAIPYLGEIPLRELTPLHVERWIRHLQEKHLSPGYVFYVYSRLRTALNDAIELGLIASNPAERKGRWRALLRAPQPKEPTVLDAELRSLFLAKVRRESPHWLIFKLDLQTGLRRGEILGLRRADVVWEGARAVLMIKQQVSAIPGQGLVLAPLKTRSSRRVVKLDRELTQDLRQWIQRQDERLLLAGRIADGEQLLFAHADGRPYRPEGISRHFTRLMRRITGQRIRLHDLRHTHASQLIKDGVPIKIVQERLGHSRASYTLDRYVHAMRDIQDEAVAAIERGYAPPAVD